MVVFNNRNGKFHGRKVRKQLRGRWGTLALTTTLTIALSASATLADPAQIQVQNVAAGSATFNQQGSVTNITAANKTVINYSRFDVATGTTVNFIQPSATSTVLNRVNSANPSQLHGSINANGIVYLINPSGMIFGKNSVINTAGFIAAAGNMSDADFLAGRNRFTNVNGSIINQGSITANNVALIGRDITNTGTIVAPKGAVTLVAGGEVYLSENAQGGILVKVENTSTPAGDKPAIVNSGAIHADGGCVMLSAGDLYSLAIQTSGSIKASEVKLEGGSTGVVEVTGSIDASNTTGKGGTVLVTGAHVSLTGSIDASGATDGGTVNMGGSLQGQGPLQNAQTAYVSESAVIRADGGSGQGGQVIVWSDSATGVLGTISAKGGSGGGFVETSGRDYLWVAGANVVAGQWLLDPTDVTISAAATSGGSFAGGIFTPSNVNSATVLASSIVSALEAGTSVTINTASAGGGAGNIAVNAAISPTLSNGDVTITFNAVGGFTNTDKVQGAGANALNIVINAGGAVSVQNQLDTNGGNITSSGTSFSTSGLGFLITSGGNIDLSGHTGAINLATPVSTSGGNFTSSGTSFTTTSAAPFLMSGGSVDINNTGLVTIGANIDTTGGTGGEIIIQGSAINLGANLSTTDGDLYFGSAVSLTSAVNLATAGGDVTFDGAAINGGNDLTISASTGTVTLFNVGNTTPLTVLNVLSSGGVGFTGTTYTAAQQSYNAGGGAFVMAAGSPATFTAATSLAFLNGSVLLSDGSDLNINTPNGTINLLGIEGTSAEDVNINAGTGAISVGAIGTGNPGGIEDVTLTAGGGITLNGNMQTSGAVAINGNLALGNTISIITANETFTVTGTTNGAHGLSVNTGSAQTTFVGIIGGSSPLTILDIVADAISLPVASTVTTRVGLTTGTAGNSIGVEDATADLNFTDAQLDSINTALVVIGDAGHTGEIRVADSGPVTQAKNLQFITAAPGAINIAGLTTTAGGTLTVTNGGQLTITSAINLDGAFTQNGSGVVQLNDGITTTNDNISFASAVNLGFSFTLSTGVGAGNISFADTINGGVDLTLAAGTGNVTLSGAVGGTTALNSLTVSSATTANLANITTDGAQAITATTINLNGAAYTSNNDAITFTGATVLGNDVTITSGGGAGDDVTFTSTVNGAHDLTINAGASGIVTFTGNVGTTTALGNLTVDALSINFVGNVGGGSAGVTGATELTALGGVSFDGTVYNFGGEVEVDSQGSETEFNAAGLTINFTTSGDNVSFLTSNVAVGGGNTLVINTSGSGSGAGDVNFAGNITSGGVDAVLNIDAGSAEVTVNTIGGGDQVLAVDISGGTITLGGNIITSSSGSVGLVNNHVTLDGDVVLTGSRTINTSAAGSNGAITLNGTVSSSPAWVNGLTLIGNVGGVDLSGTSLTNLDFLSINTQSLTLGELTLGDGASNAGTALQVVTVNNLTLTGDISTAGDTSGNAGNIDFSGVGSDIILDAASITLTTNATGTDADITIGGNIQGTVAGGNDLTINTGNGDITINGEMGTGTRLGELTLRGNDVALNADMESTGLDIRTNNSGSITLGDGADTFDVNGGDVILYSDSTTINGAATVTSSGATDASINFAAESAATSIGIGDNAAGTLNLSEASLQAIDSTFTTIIIGQAGLQSGDIMIDDTGGLTLANAGLRIEAGNADVFIESDVILTGIGISDFTIIGSGATTTIDSDIVTSGGVISIDDSVIVENDVTLATTGGGQTAGANISITGNIDDDGNVNNLTFDAGTGGAITVGGDIGDTDPLGVLTITQSASATFGTDDTNRVSVNTMQIDDTVGSVTFKGELNVTTLTTAAEGYRLVLEHESYITNATTLINTGGVTLGVGSDGDIIHFAGGLISTASITTLNGEVRAEGNAIELGAVVLAGNSALDSTNGGGNPAGADVTTAAVTGNDFNLTLNAGNGVGSDINVGFLNGLGTVTITQSDNTNFNGSVIADTVTLTDTNDTITFTTNATIGTLNTAAQGYSVLFNGAVTSVTNAATFSNTGGVTLGNGGDSLAFNGGLVSTASTTTLGGTIITINNPIALGTTQVSSTSSLSSGSGLLTVGNTTLADGATLSLLSSSGNIQAGSISGTAGGAASNITFNSTSGTVTVTGAIGTDIGTLTITNSGGTTFQNAVNAATVTLTNSTGIISFQGNLTATTLNTAAQGYNVSLTGANNTITNAVNFLNTNGVTLGNGGGDVSTFTGGLTSTASATAINSTVRTDGNPITLNLTLLLGNSVLDTTNNGGNPGGNDITTGQVNGNGFDLTLNAGNAVGSDINLGGFLNGLGTVTIVQSDNTNFIGIVNVGTITLTDTNGTIAFLNNVTATNLNTAAQGYEVSLTGSSNTFTNAVTFSNTGGVTFGDATTDVSLFNGGITSTASTTTTQGFIRTSGDTASFGVIALADDTTIDTTNNGGSPAGGTITLGGTVDGAGIDLTLNGGSTGNLTINNDIGNGGAIGLLTMTGNNVSFDADTTSTGLLVTAQGDVTVGAGETIDFGNVASTINAGGTLSAGFGAWIDGSAALTLRPLSSNIGMDIGDDALGATGGMAIQKSFVSVVSDNVTQLEFGYTGTQTGLIVINENSTLVVATNLIIHAGGGLGAANNLTLTEAGDSITVNGDTTFGGNGTWATNNGDITLNGTLALGDGVFGELNSNGGDVEITGTVDGIDGNFNETLIISAGTGTITLGSDVGMNTTLGAVQLFADNLIIVEVINALTIQLSGGTSGSVIGVEDAGDLQLTLNNHLFRLLTDLLVIGDTANTGGINYGTNQAIEDVPFDVVLFSDSGNIVVNNDFSSINGASLILDTGGAIIIAPNVSIDLDGQFTASNAFAMALGGSFTTTNDDITINTAVTLFDDVELNTGSGGGNIVLNGTVDDDGSGRTLTLFAGTGNVDLQGDVGSGSALASLLVDGAALVTAQGDVIVTDDIIIAADEVNFTGGAGSVSGDTITFAPFSGTVTSILLGNNAGDPGVGTLDLNDADIAALANGFSTITIGLAGNSVPITVHSSGATFSDSLTLNADGVGGSVLVSGTLSTAGNNDAATLTINGSGATTTLSGNLVTQGAQITINDAVILGSSVLIDTTNAGASATGGNITFTGPGTIEGTTFTGENLTLRAGTAGDIVVDGAIGQGFTTRLGDLTIVSANDATFNGPISGVAITQNAGTGTTTFNGTVVSTGNNINLTTNEVVLNNAGFGAFGGGSITINGAFTVDSNSDIFANFAFTQSGGDMSLGSDIETANSGLTIGGALTLTDNVTLSVGTGANATAALNNTVDAGAHNLTITADEINFTGGVDSVTGSGTLTLQPNNDSDAIQLGGGDPGINTLTLTNADLLALQDGFTLINIGRTTGSHVYTVQTALPDPTFKDEVVFRGISSFIFNGELAFEDAVTFNGPLMLAVSGNAISTTGDDITINGDITVDDGFDPVITTNGGPDADIIINGEINGTPGGDPERIALAAGNDVTLTGDVAIDDFEVNFGLAGLGGVLTITDTVTQIDAANIGFNGDNGDDTLIINNPTGTVLQTPNGAIAYDGGLGNDSLQILGGSATNQTYTVGPANDEGTLVYNDGVSDVLTINFSGLEPIVDTVAVVNFTINADNNANTIDITDGSAVSDGQIMVAIDAFESIEFANKTNLVINGLDGSDTLNWSATELSTGLTSFTFNGGADDDTLTLGDGVLDLSFFTALLTFNGGTGSDTLIIDDSPNSSAVNVTLTNAAITGLLGDVSYSGTELLTLSLGSGGNELTVQSTAGGADYTINTGSGDDIVNVQTNDPGATVLVNLQAGDDTVNVGNAGSVGDILGALTINGDGQSDTLNLDDSANAVSATYTLTGTTFTRTGIATITFATLEQINLDGGLGGNTIYVQAVGATTPVTINTGAGNDDVFVDANGAVAGGDVDSILGLLTLDGQAGTNTLTLNDVDTAAGSKQLTIDGGTLGQGAGDDFFGSGSVVFSNVSDLTINLGDDLNVVGNTTLMVDTLIDGTTNDSSVSFAGMIDGPGGLTIDVGNGSVTFDGFIGSTTTLASLEVDAALIFMNAGVVDTAGSQTYNGGVFVGGATEFFTSDAGSSIVFNGLLDGSGFDLLVSSFEINFNGGSDSVLSNGGRMTLLSPDNTQAIVIGAAADSGAANLDITDTDIDALADGFERIIIGNSNGEHSIVVDASGASFKDSIELRAPVGAGEIIVDGQLDTLAGGDAGSITLQPSAATTYLNADLVTAGGDIIISDAVIVGDGLTVLLDTTDGGNVATGASITIDGTIDGAVAGTSSLDLEAGSNGQVTLLGAVGGDASLDNLYIRSGNAAGFTLTQSVNVDSIVRIVSGGIVNQTGGSLTVPVLGVIANGEVTMTGAGNDVDTFAAANSLANGNVSLTDVDGLSVGSVADYRNFTLTNGITTTGNGNTTLIAGDSVTQTEAISTNLLTVKTRNDGGAGITLDHAGNDVNGIDLQVRNAADDDDALGDILFRDADGFDVVLISTLANVTLHNGDTVTQTGTITADGLELLGTGVYTLGNASNDVNTLAADLSESLYFADADDLTVGTVNSTNGITTTNDDVILQIGLTLAIDQAVNVGAGNLTLNTGDAITQTDPTGTITAAGLELLGAGPVTLTLATNDVDTLAVNRNGAISFSDVDDLIIGTVNATNGITNTGNVTLVAGNDVTQTQAIIADLLTVTTRNDAGAVIILDLATNNVTSINLMSRNLADDANANGDISFRDTNGFAVAGLQTTGNAILQSGAAVTQTGALSATTLELLGSGPFTLDHAGNDIDILAADVTNALTFNDADDLTIDTVNATNGITTTGDAVTITATGDLSIDKAITTDGGVVTLTGGTVTSTSDGDINTLATAAGGNGGNVTITSNIGAVTLAGDIDASGADNAAGDGGSGGNVIITAAGVADPTADITVALINTSAGDALTEDDNGGIAGDISLIVNEGDTNPRIQLNGNLTAQPGSVNEDGEGLPGGGGIISFVFSNAAVDMPVDANLDTAAGVVINGVARRGRLLADELDFYVPDTATIVFRRIDHTVANVGGTDPLDLTVTINAAGALTFGPQEKITSLGNLTIDGPGGGAVLNMGTDLTVIGDFTLIDITSLTFQRRPAGTYWPVSGNLLTDLRGDLVINGTFTTGGAAVMTASDTAYIDPVNKPVIITATGGVIGGGVVFADFFDIWFMLNNPTLASTLRNNTPEAGIANGTVLDIRGVGVPIGGLATSLAAALPDDVTNREVLRSMGADLAAIDDLRTMNVPAVPPTGDQLINWFMDEAQTFDDMGGTVTSLRLPNEAVLQARDVFASIYWVTARDPETGELKRVGLMSEQVREKLRLAVEDYRDKTSGDPQVQDLASLTRSLSPKAGEAGDYVNRMRLLLQKVNIMGLTAYEQLQVENFLVNTYKPENLTAEQFRALLRQGPAARGVVPGRQMAVTPTTLPDDV